MILLEQQELDLNLKNDWRQSKRQQAGIAAGVVGQISFF